MERLKTITVRWIIVGLLAVILIMGYVYFARLYTSSTQKATTATAYKQLFNYFSGQNKPVTTLVILTNNAEARFGGGFIGSVFYIKADHGIKPSPIRSTYYYDYHIDNLPTFVPVPIELQEGMKAKAIALRDSANYANFPDTAKAAQLLFKKEAHIDVDNVVEFTPETLKSLLAITGPIRLDDYNLTVTPDNFSQKVQLEVEGGQDKADNQDPKTILGELAAQMITKLMNRDITQLSSLPKIITRMASQKQLAVYSSDSAIEKKLNELGLTAQLNKFAGNYIMVANSNVGADKSSQFISQKVSQTLYASTNKPAEAQVVIKRTHQLSAPAFPYYEPRKKIMMDLVGPINYNYTKVFVPKGSKLISSQTAHPVRSFDESGKTVFVFENSTAVGSSTEVSLRYQLPFSYAATNELVAVSYFEQPVGGYNQDIELTIIPQTGYILKNMTPQKSNFIYNGSINSDLKIETSFERKP